MDFVSKNRVEVNEKILQSDLPEKVNSELTEQMATNRGSYGVLRVSDLRNRLEERGLDIDGSKEAMCATLMENDSSQVR